MQDSLSKRAMTIKQISGVTKLMWEVSGGDKELVICL